MAKQTVIERMRAAERWLAKLPGHSGEPFAWLRTLILDAMQEMQSESGHLWMQTMTGGSGHVRIFVEGEMGSREQGLLLEMLQLVRNETIYQRQARDVDGGPPTASETETPATHKGSK